MTSTGAFATESARLARPALLAAALAATAMAASAPLWGFFSPASALFWLRIAAGLAFIVAGFIASQKRSGRRLAMLMIGAGLVYFIPYVGYSRFALPFTIGIVAWSFWHPIAAHIVVAFPEGRLRTRFDAVLVTVIYVWTIVQNPLVATVDDPRDSGCDACPRNLLLVDGNATLHDTLGKIQGASTVVLAALVLAVLAKRWRHATRPERRVLTPLFAVFALGVTAVAAQELAGALDVSVAALEYVQLSTQILLPFAVLTGLLVSLVARSAIGNLLVRVGQSNTPAELERDIAWALGDPSARVAYRHRESGGFFTAAGDPVEVPPADSSRTTTVIEGEDENAAALVYDASLQRDDPALVQAVAAATRLALENQRLQTEIRLTRDVPAGLAERLLRQGRRIGDTETLTITVLMTDVRGYSTLAERGDPLTLAAQLNEHRRALNGVIADRGGTVMQFVGDEVFAVFGAPLPVAAHASKAVSAALEIQRAQAGLNDRWRAAGLPPFGLGIAVTTGDVAAALLGSEEHVEYSVVGDVVNLAQRLQQWAAAGEVVISEATYLAIPGEVEGERLPATTVKGRRSPVTAYRVRAHSHPRMEPSPALDSS
jgi:class 3 adenylate cyclase